MIPPIGQVSGRRGRICPPVTSDWLQPVRRASGVFRYTGRAVKLVWETDRALLAVLATLTIVAGGLPATTAYVGRRIVDAVVAADRSTALAWIAGELALVTAMAAAQRGIDVAESILRVKLGHKVNVLILDKALELELVHFEDSELYDRMTRARRE